MKCCAVCCAGKAWWDQFLQSSYHKMGSQTPQVGISFSCSQATQPKDMLHIEPFAEGDGLVSGGGVYAEVA